jgi:hypothetical protein
MGCDIHLIVQYRERANGAWLPAQRIIWDKDYERNTLEPWFDTRNYALFRILADVRFVAVDRIISEPRGIPEDMHASVERHDYMGFWLGDHDHSFLQLNELITFFDANEDMRPLAGDFYTELMPRLCALAEQHEGPENVRIVFGFDSYFHFI